MTKALRATSENSEMGGIERVLARTTQGTKKKKTQTFKNMNPGRVG